MPAPSPDPILLGALAALLEVAQAAGQGPVPSTLVLRALLALLHDRSDGDVGPYREFWATVRSPDYAGPQPGYMRATLARTSWCGIVRTLGLEPQSMELHDRLHDLLDQQRALNDPAYRSVRAARMLRMAGEDAATGARRPGAAGADPRTET